MFRIGDNLVCVYNRIPGTSGKSNLTTNRIYKVVWCHEYHKNIVGVRNDDGLMENFYISYFMTLKEYRKRKIKKLCSKLEI